MRIAMLHADLPPESNAGVPHQVSRLADALARRGNDVTVVTLSPRPDDVHYDVRQIRGRSLLQTKFGRLAVLGPAFAARRFGAFDVVHAHGDSHFLVRRRVPVVRTFYGSARDEARFAQTRRRRYAQTVHSLGERVARRTATVTVGISRATEASIGPLDSIIPCGIDLTRFHPGPKSERPAVLFVGTLGGRKRGALLVEVFEREVLPAMPDAELWLVADAPATGPSIRTWAKITDDEIACLYRRAWVFVLPSLYEGFGVPYIEAMASGTAVVATPNAGAAETVGSAGRLVSEHELGATITGILHDQDARRAAERRGIERARRFDWQRVAADYERVYESAVAGRTHKGDR